MPVPTFRWFWAATDITPTINRIDASLATILQACERLESMVTKMAASQADLDAALSTFETALTAQITEIQNSVAAILAKVGPSIDLSAEVTRIQTASTELQSAADAIKTEAGA
jgi:hypothetical protein